METLKVEALLALISEKLNQTIPDDLFDPEYPPVTGDHELNSGITDLSDLEQDIRPAAVLVPLIRYSDKLNILLTRRSEHLSTHAGQIAFPGGKVDDTDHGPVAAALRETEEEVGIQRNHVDILGHLDSYQTGSGFRILPIVGIINEGYSYKLEVNEVDEIFEVPLDFLMSPENHKRESIFWKNKDRHYYAMPYENRYIWGATAGIIRNLYERLYR